MDEKQTIKTPLVAAFFSGVIPGCGHFYLHMPVKALSYMALMATLIVTQVHAERAEHHVIVALLMSAFYFFQIYDAFQDAKKSTTIHPLTDCEPLPSMWIALSLIAAGIVLQLNTLDVINLDISTILDFWPVILIVLGLRMVTNRNKKEQ